MPLAVLALLVAAGCSTELGDRSAGALATADVRSENPAAFDGPRVRVTGPDGRVRPDAVVWLVDPREVQPERAVIASRTLGDWVAASRAIAAETGRTGPEGVARFRSERPDGLLVACEDGALFGSYEQTKGADGGDMLELRLSARRSFAVELRDPDGGPAEGVAVTLGVPDPATPGRPFSLPSTSITDGDGRAVLYEPPRQATDVLEGLEGLDDRVAIVRLPASELKPIELARGGELTTAELPALGPLVLRCAHRGLPPEAWSGIIQLFPAADGSRSDRTLARALESGTARFERVSLGEDLRAVVVLSEASAPERFVGTMTVAVRAAETDVVEASTGARVVELDLDAGLLISGRLVDEAGKALAGVTTDLFVVGDAANSWTVVTDADGGFRWLLLRPGKKLSGIVIGARTPDGRVIERLGEVEPGDLVDLGELAVR